MPSFVNDFSADNVTGKRKRDVNALDERDVQMKMDMLAASQAYTTHPHPLLQPHTNTPFPSTNRQILAPRSLASAHKRRFLLSPKAKESVTFPGSPAYPHTATTATGYINPFSTLKAYSISPPQHLQRSAGFDLPLTLNTLEANIRALNQGIANSHANAGERTATPSPILQPQLQTHSQLQAQLYDAPATKMNLEPCHVCMRRPRQRKDLECYSDCEGCGRRCCVVCVRVCLGPDGSRASTPASLSPAGDGDFEMGDGGAEEKEAGEVRWPEKGGHRMSVCSRCCVERGEEGEVRCLACVGGEEGG